MAQRHVTAEPLSVPGTGTWHRVHVTAGRLGCRSHLGVGGHQLHVGFQELEAALVAEQHDEVAVGPAPAGLGVAIAAEEAVGDVQHPLLGLPPGPGCSCVRVLGLPLLHPFHMLYPHQLWSTRCA